LEWKVSGSNVVSVAEHVVMNILLLVRNFVPAHEVRLFLQFSGPEILITCSTEQQIERGEWKVSEVARNAFDLENKVIGTIGAGRIGYRVLQVRIIFLS